LFRPIIKTGVCFLRLTSNATPIVSIGMNDKKGRL
jgi:hypothetical protein